MTKTQEELMELKKEYQELTTKLKELNEDELKQVTGGGLFDVPENKNNPYEPNFYHIDTDKDFPK